MSETLDDLRKHRDGLADLASHLQAELDTVKRERDEARARGRNASCDCPPTVRDASARRSCAEETRNETSHRRDRANRPRCV